jgi:two-component system, OmpR family, phosphate regulon sensor histidine kinase PhoR
VCDARGVDGVLLIAIIGLAIALVAALWLVRHRTDELETLRRGAESRLAALERSEAQRTAAAQARSLESLEALLPVGVLHFDADRRIDRANDRAHALLEVKPGRLLGRTIMEAFLDPRAEGMVDGVPVGGSGSGEVRVGEREPHVLVVRVHRPELDERLVVLEDATELRRLQQIRSEFIDNLSHELRTPLSTVSLLAETLARDAETSDVPARMKERITKIEVETGHLVQMVSELLDLARIEGGSQLALTDDVDLGALAEGSAERLRLFAERNGVTLVVEAAPGMPKIRGDEARLGQVFVNLVHNAIKFSPGGGEVRVVVRADRDEAVVAVIDHGIGIAKADRARIFERFYKADRARLRGGGTGLGLSIARHVVEGHGGRIWVESVEGRGSTFLFAIPTVPPDADDADAVASGHDAASANARTAQPAHP